MKADANNEAQANASGEIKADEYQYGASGNQQEAGDREGETETNPEQAPLDRPLPAGEGFTSASGINLRLSPLEGIRLLPSIRTFDLPKLGVADSLIGPRVNLRPFDTPRWKIANAFPLLVGGITQELTRSLRVLDSLPPIVNQLQLPNPSLGISQEFQSILELSLRPFTLQLTSFFTSLSLGINQGLQSILEPILRPFPPHPKARMAARLGWVVHSTLPTTVLEDADEENLDEAITTHYKENWAEVRIEIEQALSGYLVDQDSKETMAQALSAHEHGLYRLVPRAMLTEIERVVRVQLHDKIVGSGFKKETILGKVDDLPLSSFEDLTADMIQYETLENNLYKQIRDEKDRSQFTESPIPNRHAAVHGLVPYASEKSSLNSIFLADFVFRMITLIKKERITEAAEILKGYVVAAESREQESSSC